MNVQFLAAVLVFGGFALLASRDDAGADPATCVSLETRLAELEQSANDYWDGADSSAIDQAIAEGRSELDRAMMQAQRSGCQGGFRTPGARCGRIMGSVERLSANLNRLYRQRQQTAVDPYAAERERSRVLRALADNQCGDDYQDNSGARRSNGFFATLFGRRPFGADPESEGSPSVLNFGYTTFRTLCVRTCDGYYFPISFATVPEQFVERRTDLPGSLSGERGPSLRPRQSRRGRQRNGLSRRRTLHCASVRIPLPHPIRRFVHLPPGNGWGDRSIGIAAAGAGRAETSPPRCDASRRRPAARDPNRAEDPETLANRTGGFGIAGVPSSNPPSPHVIGNTAAGKPVRVVGPNYYVAQ